MACSFVFVPPPSFHDCQTRRTRPFGCVCRVWQSTWYIWHPNANAHAIWRVRSRFPSPLSFDNDQTAMNTPVRACSSCLVVVGTKNTPFGVFLVYFPIFEQNANGHATWHVRSRSPSMYDPTCQPHTRNAPIWMCFSCSASPTSSTCQTRETRPHGCVSRVRFSFHLFWLPNMRNTPPWVCFSCLYSRLY